MTYICDKASFGLIGFVGSRFRFVGPLFGLNDTLREDTDVNG